MKIVLGNIDLKSHITDEGDQLQRGLSDQGWILCGTGYGDGCQDVKILLERFQPKVVFVTQKSDWDPKNSGAFRKDLGFSNLGELKARKDILKICPVKDASGPEYQRQFCEETGANLVVHYYHKKSISAVCPWLAQYRLHRIFHSIDMETAQFCFQVDGRKRGIVSGAVSGVYPLREMIYKNATSLEIDRLSHPGYSNRGSFSTDYLKLIGGYKVSIATSSMFGFALRKIIEAVAVGATPITDLPDYDVMPFIDEALFRVERDITAQQMRTRIDFAESQWNFDERMKYAQACWKFYDWRVAGERLNAAIDNVLEYRRDELLQTP